MFDIVLLFVKKADHVALEAELICPDVAQADIAEDELFYGDDPPPNMLLTRISPTTIRFSSLDFEVQFDSLFTKPEGMEHLSLEDSIRARAPSFVTFEDLHIQRNGVLARVLCDVATYSELNVAERAA